MSAPRKIWVDIVGESTWMHVNGSQKYADDALYHHDDVVRELAALVGYLAGENDDHVRVALAGNPDTCDGVMHRARIALAKIAQEG